MLQSVPERRPLFCASICVAAFETYIDPALNILRSDDDFLAYFKGLYIEETRLGAK